MNQPVAVRAVETVLLAGLNPPVDLVRALRRADEFINLAVVGARLALAKLPAGSLAPAETGIFIGTAYGPLETNFMSLGSLIDDGEGQISPTLFSHSVYNAAAGYVSRLLDIHGPALTVTTYAWPLITALNQARLAIRSARIKRAVVLAVETYSALLNDACRRWHELAEVPWQPGAVAWVLEPAEPEARAPRLAGITITETACDPGLLLARSGEQWRGKGLPPGEGRDPMSYAMALTAAMAGLPVGEDGEPLVWKLGAPFGEATISLVG